MRTQSIESTEGYLITSEAGDSACSEPTLKMGFPMGQCHTNVTAQDSYYFSCKSVGTDIFEYIHYCSSDTTCATCNSEYVVDTFAVTACSATDAVLWNYYAGATCTSSEDPFEDYDKGLVSLYVDKQFNYLLLF